MIVLDTHALVWWAAQPAKLSAAARRAAKAAAAANTLFASAISLFEISTLVRRGRLELGVDAERWMTALRALPELGIEPVSTDIAWAAGALDGSVPGDPADRIIVATAQSLGATLVTADDKLRAAIDDSLW